MEGELCFSGKHLKPMTMIKRLFFVLSVAGLLGACDFNAREKDQLRSQLDSLRSELSTSQEMANTLEEVGVLIDSIDANRMILRTSMLEGTSYDEYVRRMEDINSHIKKTQAKISELETALKSSKSAANSFSASLKKLKAELHSRNEEMAVLQTQVDRYRNENENLVHTVELQKTEIAERMTDLKLKQDEVANLELQVNDLLIQSKIDEAEAYFLRAQAVEMAANRTKFAPRKKRETREEALQLYRLASFYGKEEAKPKIAELEEKI